MNLQFLVLDSLSINLDIPLRAYLRSKLKLNFMEVVALKPVKIKKYKLQVLINS